MKKLFMIVLCLLCLGVTACSVPKDNASQFDGEKSKSMETTLAHVPSYKNIKPEEAKKRLDNEKGIILLDVRTEEEYAEKHIPNSLLIPVEVIEEEAPSKLSDKSATIFVYCRSGRRSVTASETLVKMGYTNIYNLGGINDWPYETESGSVAEI